MSTDETQRTTDVANLPPQLRREPRTAAQSTDEPDPIDAAATGLVNPIANGANSADTVSDLEQSAAFLASIDLTLVEPIFDAQEFRDLRDRLFGQRQPESFGFTTDLSAEVTSQVEVPAARTLGQPVPRQAPTAEPDHEIAGTTIVTGSETGTDTAVELEPETEAEATGGGGDDDRLLDWTTVSPLYAPRIDEPNKHRGWVFALVGVALVIAAIGGWLAFGPSASDTGAGGETQTGTSVTTGTTPGVDSTVALAHGTTVAVRQDIVLRDPVSSITLRVPDRTGTPTLAGFDPRIEKLKITTSDGADVLPFTQSPFGVGTHRLVTFAGPTRAFSISYLASSSVVVSEPSARGRGLLLATPLLFSDTSTMSRTVEVEGAGILNLGCVPPGGVFIECGAKSTPSWTVSQQLGPQTGDVVAQVDLPPAT